MTMNEAIELIIKAAKADGITPTILGHNDIITAAKIIQAHYNQSPSNVVRLSPSSPSNVHGPQGPHKDRIGEG